MPGAVEGHNSASTVDSVYRWSLFLLGSFTAVDSSRCFNPVKSLSFSFLAFPQLLLNSTHSDLYLLLLNIIYLLYNNLN